jgi:hypothetical protein
VALYLPHFQVPSSTKAVVDETEESIEIEEPQKPVDEQLYEEDIQQKEAELIDEGEDERDPPVFAAIITTVGCIAMSAGIFCIWEEEWDYFTSFYFTFISLSTIGNREHQGL